MAGAGAARTVRRGKGAGAAKAVRRQTRRGNRQRAKATNEAQRWQRPECAAVAEARVAAAQEERAPPHRPAQAAGTRTLCSVETCLSKAG